VPPTAQTMLHVVDPLQSTVHPPSGHVTLHELLPPHVTDVFLPTVMLQVLVP
jgi:hypothetical protein